MFQKLRKILRITKMNALEFELNAVKERYNNAFERLQEFALGKEDWNKGLKEVVIRLLTSRVLDEAVGGFWQPNGYMLWLKALDSPLNRMEFIVHFIGNELLDDGDPGIGWHRYAAIDNCCEMEDCLETDSGAKPYFHNCHELLPADGKHLYIKDVIWILDWHERREEEFYKHFNDIDNVLDHQNKIEERPPENPMLVELVREICGGVNDQNNC